MTQLQQRIQLVRSRLQRQWMWSCLSWGLIAGGGVACLMGIIRLLTQGAFGWSWVVGPLACGAMLGLLFSWLTRRSEKESAYAIDRVCNLKDRTQTALQFMLTSNSDAIRGNAVSVGDHRATMGMLTGNSDAMRRLQVEDAEAHAATILPEKVAPIHSPRLWSLAISLTVTAFILAVFSGPQPILQAMEQANVVVERQADRIEQHLEELKQLQEQESNPELEQLVKELQELIEQMKLPGVNPKEALAKISEMEASLQQMQQQLDDPQTSSELQQIGEALSLSDAMATAGAALSKGELDKAAEQLEKLDMPELDRKTETSVTEKLDNVNRGNQEGTPKSKTQQAASQISQGLSQGNRGKFQDGMHGLAGEARKQGRKKKLSDLLKKQCQCLSECKGECESECRNQAEGNKKGGSKAGTAASGNQPGDKTGKLKTNPQMNIKGQESSSGDSEIETMSGDEQQQEALRNYRERVDEYEALTESVLESESIPLGHRQTIRKYFQMIRPSNAETDEVIRASGSE